VTALAHRAGEGSRTLFTNCIRTVQNAVGWGATFFGAEPRNSSSLIAILLTDCTRLECTITHEWVRGCHVSPTGFLALSSSAFFTKRTLTAARLLDSKPRLGVVQIRPEQSGLLAFGITLLHKGGQVFLTNRTLTDRRLLRLLMARLLGFLAGACPSSRVV